MEEKLNRLKTLLYEIHDLGAAQAVLGWDQLTYMPPGGAEERSEQLATLARMAHEKATAPEIGRLLQDLVPYANQLDPDSDEACLIAVTQRQYDKSTRVPPDWVAEFARATAMGQAVWERAKNRNQFELFRPELEKIIELRRQYADFFAPYEHVYDPMLDDYEPGLTTAEVQAIFAPLRFQQVELIQRIMKHPQVDDSFLKQAYPEQAQWDFGVEAITRIGFDWQRGRQDRSAHPFTTHFGLGDVRITTRFESHNGTMALFSTLHEGGHALYEQGLDPSLRRTPLAEGASMAVHESQSRLWENLVGRSYAFWKFFYPRLQRAFPQQLGAVSLESFYKGINKVNPTLIRVEADEATYNLHIMLRLELEIAMLEGSLAVKDLPEAWRVRMKDYLNLEPPNDAQGVLQDVHWSGGMVGYFPTYALGNLISAQLWEKVCQEIPDLEAQIEQGEFSHLLAWLREKIHRHGAKFLPQELVQRVTGSKIDSQPYLRYLKAKYEGIYGS